MGTNTRLCIHPSIHPYIHPSITIHLHIPLSIRVCPPLCPSAPAYIHQSIYPRFHLLTIIHLAIHHTILPSPIHPSICPSIHLTVHHPSISHFIHLSIYQSLHPFFHPSVHPHTHPFHSSIILSTTPLIIYHSSIHSLSYIIQPPSMHPSFLSACPSILQRIRRPRRGKKRGGAWIRSLASRASD